MSNLVSSQKSPYSLRSSLLEFVEYVKLLKGDEIGEAQVFCDRLFIAFGHKGYKEAGAEQEFRIKRRNSSTGFIDLIWKPRLLLEMKKRGTNLQRHYRQAFEYWQEAVPNRPRYIILCNFDEIWIYDFDIQLRDPVDKINTVELPSRYTALNFMLPEEKAPLFGDNRVIVTRSAADKVASVFNSLINRDIPHNKAQRFVLQSVVAMFAEDTELIPRGFFSELLHECSNSGAHTYDIVGGLFRQMNDPVPAAGGRYSRIPYFNGGIFSQVQPIDLIPDEIELLIKAAEEDWSKVQPAIFGTLFQASLGKEERHALGAHYTSEADINKVVFPTIVKPWREKIQNAKTFKQLHELLTTLRNFKVLDPACGSGNFLYVAFLELNRLELELMARIHCEYKEKAKQLAGTKPLVSPKQFYGIEKEAFGVELAKITITLARELAIDDNKQWLKDVQDELPIDFDPPLPLLNLDNNFQCADALFTAWPKVDAIIGNPPFQSKNKALEEFGPKYLNKVRKQYPEVPGHADYCVYWFRRAHDELPANGAAGLVGTKTIRETNSRKGGLDYIVSNGGTIVEAVSRQVWSGEADVDVSIVNWVKGRRLRKKKLFLQIGDRHDSPFEVREMDYIHAGLSYEIDLGAAIDLRANDRPKTFFQGLTPGSTGFLLTQDDALMHLARCPSAEAVLQPYLIGDDILGNIPPKPTRYIINFTNCDLLEASKYADLFKIVQEKVLAARTTAERKEADRNLDALADDTQVRTNQHHKAFLRKWWQPVYARQDLTNAISQLQRVVVCVRTTKRPIFTFVDPKLCLGDSLQVFAFADDYSFGILQSPIHWHWFTERCSKLSARFRYTSETVYSTFPWPQNPSIDNIRLVCAAAVHLREIRRKIMTDLKLSLRGMYRLLEIPGDHELKRAHTQLDIAVRRVYGMSRTENPLQFLFTLNQDLAIKEGTGREILGPGLPHGMDLREFYTTDIFN